MTQQRTGAAAGDIGGELAVECRGMTKLFAGRSVVTECGLSVRRGEVLGLIGANGAGKSTLIKMLSGALVPDSGEIRIGDWTGSKLTPREAHELGVSTVYQDVDLVPALSAVDNLVLGDEPKRGGVFLDRREAARTALANLEQVGLVPSRCRVPVSRLSRAEQQLVEIAKALHRDARVILMDEPTAPLGPHEASGLFLLMRELIKSGVAIVYVSHKLEELLEVSHRIQVLRDGKHVWTKSAEGLSKHDIVDAMIGAELDVPQRPRAEDLGPVLLKVEDLGQGVRLRGVSLEVRGGEVLGIGGLVGAGRSRLLRILSGAEQSDAGAMTLRGQSYQPSSPADAIASGVGLIPSDRKRDGLYSTMDIEANITAVRPASRWNVLRRRKNRATADDWIARLGIIPKSGQAPVRSLSGGNQQKVLVARWLHADIDVLLIDEPGEGVDVQGKSEIYEIVRGGAREGKAVIVVSSETEELFQLADRVAVMRRGEVVGYLNESVSEGELLRLATGTESSIELGGVTS